MMFGVWVLKRIIFSRCAECIRYVYTKILIAIRKPWLLSVVFREVNATIHSGACNCRFIAQQNNGRERTVPFHISQTQEANNCTFFSFFCVSREGNSPLVYTLIKNKKENFTCSAQLPLTHIAYSAYFPR